MVNIILGSTKFELQYQSDKDKRRIITRLGAVLYLKLEEAVIFTRYFNHLHVHYAEILEDNHDS